MTDPDVLFLAEAFTRPAMMRAWPRSASTSPTPTSPGATEAGAEEYLARAGRTGARRTCGPNFFVNTPDILHDYLQYGGPAAFKIRAVLAATLAPTWGMYSGYELDEHVPVRPGQRGVPDSEKYQLRPRDWAPPTGRGLADSSRAEPDPAGPPGAALTSQPALPRTDDERDALQQAR